MAATGFFEQKPTSPLSFGAVLMLHGALIGAVVLIKNPTFIRSDNGPIIVETVPVDPPPPPEKPVEPVEPQKLTISRVDAPDPLVRPPIPSPTWTEPYVGPSTTQIGEERVAAVIPTPLPPLVERVEEIPVRRPPPPPVRVEAQFDPRYANAMQPPYPAPEVRLEREGTVRVRVTIAPSGRVTAVQQLSATSPAFFQATQRQALSSWRFSW